MAKIQDIKSREILDSRGIPTIETKIILEDGNVGACSVPSGVSIGTFEAVELRDNDPNRFHGMGVLRAISNVNEIIAPRLKGAESQNQKDIDNFLISLDPSPNKATLGANAILSISLAVAKASSLSLKLPLYIYLNNLAKNWSIDVKPQLPTPMFNVINGGKHGAGNLDFQEFHIIPASFKTFSEKLRIGTEIYQSLKKVLIYRNAIHSIGDEGGFAPNLFTNMDALEMIAEAIKETFYRLGETVFLGLDVAASHFKKDGGYQIKDKPTKLDTSEFIDYYTELNNKFHLLLLEDALAEDDWKGWIELTQKLGNSITLIGDDLLATNPERLDKAIKEKACNAILVKPNQIGSLSETLNVVSMAKKAGFKVVISHRSGETTDTFIADLAVGIASDYAKFGAPARGERVVKYNRLMEIEEELNQKP